MLNLLLSRLKYHVKCHLLFLFANKKDAIARVSTFIIYGYFPTKIIRFLQSCLQLADIIPASDRGFLHWFPNILYRLLLTKLSPSF